MDVRRVEVGGNEVEAEDEEDEEEETPLSAFKHWLSLLSEHSIPRPFREVLS